MKFSKELLIELVTLADFTFQSSGKKDVSYRHEHGMFRVIN